MAEDKPSMAQVPAAESTLGDGTPRFTGVNRFAIYPFGFHGNWRPLAG